MVNSHLYVAMTAGLVGLGFWILIWLYPVFSCWLSKRGKWGIRGIYDPCELPVMMILVPMITLTFTSFIDRNPIWPSIGLGLVGPCLAIRKSVAAAMSNADAPGRMAARKIRPLSESDPVLQGAPSV